MKRILVLGAGKSSPSLIHYLLDHSTVEDWIVTVADLDPDLAATSVGGHPRGEAIACDAASPGRLATTIEHADLVVNLLPPALQYQVARHCIDRGSHMVSPSYSDAEVESLADEARQRGVCLLVEIGLDPGIDHMASMSLIDRVHSEGGIIDRFESYGSGVPAPDSIDNPLKYAITWDPRGVVRAGEAGAHYLRDGKLRAVPRHQVFSRTWPVEIEGVGTMEAYPNRDSLAYRDAFGLAQAHTLIRGTLRYPGWCETWHQVVRLGLTTERITIPQLAELRFAELVEMFLPDSGNPAPIDERTADFLGLEPQGTVMENLRWLGLFSGERIGGTPKNATDALVNLMTRRLTLPPDGRDMVILHHVLEARIPARGGSASSTTPAAPLRQERTEATLVHFGDPGGTTAMARTVGLPAALATRLLLDGELDLRGLHLPTEPRIYRPILTALESEGIRFLETTHTLGAGHEKLSSEGATDRVHQQ